MATDSGKFLVHPDYPLPDVDHPVTAPFWAGCRKRHLLIQQDRRNGTYHWPPKPAYWKGRRLRWVEVSGRGRVYSWVVAREPFLPAFRHLLPLILVVVELEEGPRLVGYMVSCPLERMRLDLPVEVEYRDLNDRVTLPVWRPA